MLLCMYVVNMPPRRSIIQLSRAALRTGPRVSRRLKHDTIHMTGTRHEDSNEGFWFAPKGCVILRRVRVKGGLHKQKFAERRTLSAQSLQTGSEQFSVRRRGSNLKREFGTDTFVCV